jgi:DnaJ-class molecular chaperone
MIAPPCHKCVSVVLKPFIMSGHMVYHMVGCNECRATSYEEARTMCPLIKEDKKLCPDCDGSGEGETELYEGIVNCLTCEGRGFV